MSRPDQLLEGIRLIVLDAVGTVITPHPSVKSIYTEIGRKYGSELPEDEVDRRFRAVFRATERNGARQLPDLGDADAWKTSEAAEYGRWREIVATVLDDVHDLAACFDDLFAHFARASAWRVYPDVGPALNSLQERGFELALASNFDARLNTVCDGIPDLAPVSRRHISSLVGVRKPARAFFEAIVSAHRLSPSEVLMIGDDPINDVEGARACGLRAIRINRKTPALPDEVSSLMELVSPESVT